MEKIWACSRVFEHNAQDISIWGLMRGYYVKNCGTYYLCPSAQPSIRQHADEATRIHPFVNSDLSSRPLPWRVQGTPCGNGRMVRRICSSICWDGADGTISSWDYLARQIDRGSWFHRDHLRWVTKFPAERKYPYH